MEGQSCCFLLRLECAHTGTTVPKLHSGEPCAGTTGSYALASPEAALFAAAAVTGDGPVSYSHLGRAAEQSELESLMASLLCH